MWNYFAELSHNSKIEFIVKLSFFKGFKKIIYFILVRFIFTFYNARYTKYLLITKNNLHKKEEKTFPPSIIYDKYQIASSFSPREPITLKFFAILIDSLYFMHTNVRVNSLQLRVCHVYIL